MLGILATCLAFAARDGTPSLLSLRGGISADDAQKAVGTLAAISSFTGYSYPKESAEMYEFAEPLTPQTTAFTKMSYGVSGASALLLLAPDLFVPALAATFFAMASEFGSAFQMPRYPILAWSVLVPLMKWAMDQGQIPNWSLGAFLLGNGVAGSLMFPTMYKLYQAKAPLTKQSESMAKFVNGAFAALGVYLTAQAQGATAAKSFGYYTITFVAAILKFVAIDGVGLFNPIGGYVWAAIFAVASFIALRE